MYIFRRGADHARGRELLIWQSRKAGVLRKRIHQAGVEGMLLVGVVVTLVRGRGLRRAQPEGVHGVVLIYFYVQEIWIALEQHRGKSIHLGCSRAGFERRAHGVD